MNRTVYKLGGFSIFQGTATGSGKPFTALNYSHKDKEGKWVNDGFLLFHEQLPILAKVLDEAGRILGLEDAEMATDAAQDRAAAKAADTTRPTTKAEAEKW